MNCQQLNVIVGRVPATGPSRRATLQDAPEKFQMLWLLKRNPAPKLDQVTEPPRRWRREEETYAVSLRGWRTIDWILGVRIEIDAVFGL